MRKQERADLILKILNRIYPSLPIPLEHKNIFELLEDLKKVDGTLVKCMDTGYDEVASSASAV